MVPILPVYTCRIGVSLRAPDPQVSLELGEEKQTDWDQARDSIGGPEPIKSQPASCNTSVVGSIHSPDLACTPQSGSP